MAARKKPVRRTARAMLSSIYKRMSAAGKAGLARVKKLRNRSGFDHLAADAEDFAFIEKEANDILAAVARLRSRDAGEYSTPGDFSTVGEPAYATEYGPTNEYGPEHSSYFDPTAPDYTEPSGGGDSNMTRGRRRNRSGWSDGYGFDRGKAYLNGPVYLEEIKLNKYGYDRRGAYFGVGPKVYSVTTDDGQWTINVRAVNRTAAKADLSKKYPGIKFRR